MSESTEATVRGLLGEIAADADMSAVPADLELRDALDFDSMDLLHFAVALHTTFGIDVAQQDYARLSTIAKAVAYVQERTAPPEPMPAA